MFKHTKETLKNKRLSKKIILVSGLIITFIAIIGAIITLTWIIGALHLVFISPSFAAVAVTKFGVLVFTTSHMFTVFVTGVIVIAGVICTILILGVVFKQFAKWGEWLAADDYNTGEDDG